LAYVQKNLDPDYHTITETITLCVLFQVQLMFQHF